MSAIHTWVRKHKKATVAIATAAALAAVGTGTSFAAEGPSGAGADASFGRVPSGLKPGSGFRVKGVYRVQDGGTQTYECLAGADGTGAWSQKSTPEAQLRGSGPRIHHFGGPTWEASDGSAIVATVEKSKPKEGTIAELLLDVTEHKGGAGFLSDVEKINRLRTSDGAAPAGSCTVGEKTSVEYSATYVFYRAVGQPTQPAAPGDGEGEQSS